ncbi:unnamed protein product [Blepharisma stoltei]|uniref:Protein kinase domain-containing protein n=1 Tax=Blepharisma stoltei TaxID=1481888 RepID=A0AAU9IZC3_9CILI|nr:unnamed protein product [Blepharisma stoltei]
MHDLFKLFIALTKYFLSCNLWNLISTLKSASEICRKSFPLIPCDKKSDEAEPRCIKLRNSDTSFEFQCQGLLYIIIKMNIYKLIKIIDGSFLFSWLNFQTIKLLLSLGNLKFIILIIIICKMQPLKREPDPTVIRSFTTPGEVYSLDYGLTVAKNKGALISALRQWLFSQWRSGQRQYETIPFENITFTHESEANYIFQMENAGAITNPPIGDQEYLSRISQQFSAYLTRVTSRLREEWKERELIRSEVNINTEIQPFQAKTNQRYREMRSATMAGMDIHLIVFDSIRDWYILSNLRHNNIVPWYGMVKIDKIMYAAIQRLTVTLESFINSKFSKQRPEDLPLKLRIITQIGYGIAFMHMKNIGLNNITPWSIFIDENANNRPVIYDLDLALRADITPAPWIKRFKEEDFASPEAKTENQQIKFQNSDIYSYGILACYILTGKYPQEAFKCEFASDPELDGNIKEFIIQMLSENETRRPSAKMCYEKFEEFNRLL